MRAPLDQEYPGLAKKLESLSTYDWQTIFGNACAQASQNLAQLDAGTLSLLESLKVHGTLSAAEALTAASLADAADAKYLELQQENADEIEMLKWFSEARLLTAMAVGFRGTHPKDTADALYELLKTCDDPSQLINAVESGVHSISQR